MSYGPTITVKRSCRDCPACQSERYSVQGDSGSDVYCAHPILPERKLIGDTDWTTPKSCPAEAAKPRADAEIAQLRADAERYRKLRSMHWSNDDDLTVTRGRSVKLGFLTYSGDQLDAAIDAARGGE